MVTIASFSTLISGLCAGALFGFLLQRGGVAEFNVIVQQFLFKNFTVIKIMLTAIFVGGIGTYSLLYSGILPALSVSVFAHLGVLIGGLIFGVGMAILGLCPGTCIAAAGQGSLDAWYGLLGMLVGALLFVPFATWFQNTLYGHVFTPVLTLPLLFGVSPFILLSILGCMVLLMYFFVKE